MASRKRGRPRKPRAALLQPAAFSFQRLSEGEPDAADMRGVIRAYETLINDRDYPTGEFGQCVRALLESLDAGDAFRVAYYGLLAIKQYAALRLQMEMVDVDLMQDAFIERTLAGYQASDRQRTYVALVAEGVKKLKADRKRNPRR
jgi:hypothetical protein